MSVCVSAFVLVTVLINHLNNSMFFLKLNTLPCEHDEEDEELHDTEAAGNAKENQRDCVPAKPCMKERHAEKNHTPCTRGEVIQTHTHTHTSG